MEHTAEESVCQTDLFSLMPGVQGGRALATQRGSTYMQELGRIGGTTTRDRHGTAYFREIGRMGRQAWRDRAYRRIRVFDFAPGERHKIIPYIPVGSRRKRPIWVRFVLSDDEQ